MWKKTMHGQEETMTIATLLKDLPNYCGILHT